MTTLNSRALRRVGAFAGTLAMVTMVGCYSYQPVTHALPSAGERVRLTLTPQGTMDLARFLGPRVIVVTGTLSSVTADSALVVAVDEVTLVDGLRQPWSGEGVVSFTPRYVDVVQRHVFQRTRSIVAAGVATAALISIAVIAIKAAGAGGGSCASCPPPPP
jgi:hypothetical protein